LNQVRNIIGVLAGKAVINLSAMDHIKALNIRPKYLISMRVRKYGYAPVKKQGMLHFVMELILNFDLSKYYNRMK